MLLAGGPAIAQTNGAWPQESPGDALSRNLKTLAANPRSVDALTGAGRAALEVGDAQAALTFLARAEDESPRDGRIKMWIASALVQLEQPHAALKFFRDAVELGVPEAELARDRGLAYDITGDQRRAQRDYRLALQRGRDPEATRRLALSLAISGEREPALRVLDEAFPVREPAEERTRALVLALTGDLAGAERAIDSRMAGPQAAALAPFLARLPALSPADRALAVHLGHFPQDGRSAPASSYALNDFRSQVASPAPNLAAGRPDPLQPGLGRSTGALVRAAPAQTEPGPASSPPPPARAPAPRGAAPPVRFPPAQPQASAPAQQGPAVIALEGSVDIGRGRAATTPAPKPAPAASAEETAPPVADPPALAPPVRSRPNRLADLAATVAKIDAPPPAHAAASKPKAAPAKPAATEAAAKKKAPEKKPEPKAPSRHWVQIGIGDDEDALPAEFARLKAKGGKLLAGRSAWTAPMGETNRILVGPFPSKEEAQDFVNELAEKKLKAFAWTSPAGEKVAKLPAK